MVIKSIGVMSVFILFMYSTYAQNTSSKKICEQYPAIEDNFTADKENYHYYNIETLICTTDEFKNANKDIIYSILLSHANYVAPTYNTAAVSNCSKLILNIGAITIDTKYFIDDAYLNDPIVTVIDKSSYSVINYTLPEHRLHAGKVIRSIIQRGNSFYILSSGRGNNVSKIYGEINDNLAAMDLLWHQVDKTFVEAVRKELYNKIPSNENTGTPISSFYGNWQGFVKFGVWGFKQEMNFEISTGSSPDEVNVVASHLRLNGFARNQVTGKYKNGKLTIDFFTPKLSMKATCGGKMVFKIINYNNLQGIFETGNQECDSANYMGVRKKDLIHIDTTFKIDPKHVTLSSDKKFRWHKWEQAPKDFKNAARLIRANNGESLLSVIDECYKYPDHDVQIAAVDLNGDGICGLAVFLQSSAWCGSAGCHFELYDNGGLTTVDLGADSEVKPSKNGVIASTGRFFPLRSNARITVNEKEIMNLFTYDKTKQKQTASETNSTSTNLALKLTPPNSVSKKFIYRRWKAVDVIGNGHDNFMKMKEKGEISELQFSKNGKYYVYQNGILNFVLSFVIAPDTKSLLLSDPGKSESVSMQILSLTPNELIVKSPIYNNFIVVYKAN